MCPKRHRNILGDSGGRTERRSNKNEDCAMLFRFFPPPIYIVGEFRKRSRRILGTPRPYIVLTINFSGGAARPPTVARAWARCARAPLKACEAERSAQSRSPRSRLKPRTPTQRRRRVPGSAREGRGTSRAYPPIAAARMGRRAPTLENRIPPFHAVPSSRDSYLPKMKFSD